MSIAVLLQRAEQLVQRRSARSKVEKREEGQSGSHYEEEQQQGGGAERNERKEDKEQWASQEGVVCSGARDATSQNGHKVATKWPQPTRGEISGEISPLVGLKFPLSWALLI